VIEDPGSFIVTCDGCGKEEEMDSCEYAGQPRTWGVDDDTLEAAGWVGEGDETYCADCIEKREGG